MRGRGWGRGRGCDRIWGRWDVDVDVWSNVVVGGGRGEAVVGSDGLWVRVLFRAHNQDMQIRYHWSASTVRVHAAAPPLSLPWRCVIRCGPLSRRRQSASPAPVMPLHRQSCVAVVSSHRVVWLFGYSEITSRG